MRKPIDVSKDLPKGIDEIKANREYVDKIKDQLKAAGQGEQAVWLQQ